jgi:hypothetical protein
VATRTDVGHDEVTGRLLFPGNVNPSFEVDKFVRFDPTVEVTESDIPLFDDTVYPSTTASNSQGRSA